MYGGAAAAQYPVYGGAAAGAFYPYFEFGQGAAYGHAQGYNMQYPHMFQYSALASSTTATEFQNYGGPMSFAPSPAAQPGPLTNLHC